MGSKAPISDDLKLPFIDFSSMEHLKQGTPCWDSLKTQVRGALEEYGCFETSYSDSRVPGELRSDVFRSLEELFDLPLPTKRLNVSETAPYHGYMGQMAKFPLYESMGIDYPDLLHKVDECFTRTLWPQGNPTISKNIQSLSERLSELDQTVRRMIVESFGIEQYTDEHLSSTKYLARITKYESPRAAAEVGIPAHVDKNMVTILCANQLEGLEIQAKNGGEWIRLQPSAPSSLVVMSGESLHAWLNGRVHCPYHRVMMAAGSEARYSFGLFSMPKPGHLVEAPHELVDEQRQHPLLFKPFVYEEYLAFASAHAARQMPASLRAYCGLNFKCVTD